MLCWYVLQGTSGRRAGTAKRGKPGWDSPKTVSGLCKVRVLCRVVLLMRLCVPLIVPRNMILVSCYVIVLGLSSMCWCTLR